MLGSNAYIVGHEGSFFLIIGSASVLRQDYEQDSVGKKRGRVRLNRLSGRKMSEWYGGMVGGKQKSAELFRKSERVQESRD